MRSLLTTINCCATHLQRFASDQRLELAQGTTQVLVATLSNKYEFETEVEVEVFWHLQLACSVTSTPSTKLTLHHRTKNKNKNKKRRPILLCPSHINTTTTTSTPKPELSASSYACSQIGPFASFVQFNNCRSSSSVWSGCYGLVYLGEVNHQCTTRKGN